MDINFSDEQKDKLQNLIDGMKKLFANVIHVVKSLVGRIVDIYRKFLNEIYELSPKDRYKVLKSLGIKEYELFFRRDGVIRCRNNC